LPNASAPSSTTGNRTIDVVAAIIEDDARVLVTRRVAGVHLEGLWEFPGGKVQIGEPHEIALRREIREELDAEIDVHELVLATTHHYPDRSVALSFYRCTLKSGVHAVLGQEMQWALPETLPALAFPPADAELIELLARRRAGRP
jgi:8-oxo-dGTP diphosphatase